MHFIILLVTQHSKAHNRSKHAACMHGSCRYDLRRCIYKTYRHSAITLVAQLCACVSVHVCTHTQSDANGERDAISNQSLLTKNTRQFIVGVVLLLKNIVCCAAYYAFAFLTCLLIVLLLLVCCCYVLCYVYKCASQHLYCNKVCGAR